MRRLSLRIRLSLALAGVLTLLIAAYIALTLAGAGRRIEPEIANATALSADVLRESAKSLTPSPDLAHRLADLAASLDRLRHVRVSFAANNEPAPAAEPRARPEPPDWFVRLLAPAPVAERIEAPGAGAFLVEGDPRDEIGELWDSLVTLALDGLGSAAVGFGVVYLALGAALRPLERLKAGLAELGEGQYGARLAEAGPREFEALIGRFNALGGALNKAEQENRALRARLVSIQDEERKEIARELHDEMGPYLFAARAQAGAARRAGAGVEAVIETLDTLQAVNRRLLDRLRPAALEELGLAAALDALARLLERSREGLAVDVECDELPELEAGLETALYRIAQEALTNTARHSGARRVKVTLRADNGLILEIADDGRGRDPAAAPGRGLIGMRERAAAYGGALTVEAGKPRGTVVRAVFSAAACP